MKFKRSGSVADASRSGRAKTVTEEATSTQVLAAMVRSPISVQTGISQSSVMSNLPKLQILQYLTKDDPDLRVLQVVIEYTRECFGSKLVRLIVIEC
ncbi:hypothetical protein AVEN_239711-1 [Araneus ventricosus]|uniref:Uncharacterized protein n=1 Tax=Araneus ventricosus TaxID=182803 RepID=A0A4Y2RFT6_ARAVE|nr:hypothetical protein AVEN_239711-1 [Araneus ventricosus]